MDPYIGQIIMWAGTRIPRDWHLCDGSTLKIADYEALYSLIGTTYGGDGKTTFRLPDLRGRVVVNQGQGVSAANINLTPRTLGQFGGAESVQVTVGQTPTHTHSITATSAVGTSSTPTNCVWANYTGGKLYSSDVVNEQLATNALTDSTGGSGAHNNMMPSFAINFIISLLGIYPQKS